MLTSGDVNQEADEVGESKSVDCTTNGKTAQRRFQNASRDPTAEGWMERKVSPGFESPDGPSGRLYHQGEPAATRFNSVLQGLTRINDAAILYVIRQQSL